MTKINRYLAESRENPLQRIKFDAREIEQKTGVGVLECHLGNPLAPHNPKADLAMADFYLKRATLPNQDGYQDVAGEPEVLDDIARSVTRLNRLPEGRINGRNVLGINGGTGGLNVAMSVFGDNVTVLVSEPFYPPWKEISNHLGRDMRTYPLSREDSYLLNQERIASIIEAVNAEKGEHQALQLIYHYPHNPTGKALSEAEAKQVGETLNALCARFPNLHLVQEDLYLATTAPELGIYTPLPYLNEEALQRTILLHSPSKMGHAQERGAFAVAFEKDMLKAIRDGSSIKTLGPSHPSLRATACTLSDIAFGGRDAIGEPGTEANNYRYTTAQYYQDRLRIVVKGLQEIGQAIGADILPDGMPGGTYYLMPNFECLRGKPIPEALLPVFDGKTHFDSADDAALALKNAHLLGLQPVTVGSGSMFYPEPAPITFRLSTVHPDLRHMHGLVNTLKGLVQKTLGVELGANFRTLEQLRAECPPVPLTPAPQATGVVLDMPKRTLG